MRRKVKNAEWDNFSENCKKIIEKEYFWKYDLKYKFCYIKKIDN